MINERHGMKIWKATKSVVYKIGNFKRKFINGIICD